MPVTGRICQVSGLYRGDCRHKEYHFDKDDRAPICRDCNRSVEWILIKADYVA